MKLSSKTHYLQVALNSNLFEAQQIISSLPRSERIIVEVGTPLIKEYGVQAIRSIRAMWQQHLYGSNPLHAFTATPNVLINPFATITQVVQDVASQTKQKRTLRSDQDQIPMNNAVPSIPTPYIVADLKCMDRADREVRLAYQGGASAAIVLGQAPIETINEFIRVCELLSIDSMVDMMNIDKPYAVLRQLKQLPNVVMLHRGVDETELGDKPLPIHLINKIKGTYDVMISIAGGDTSREVQSAVFNGADIVVLWKDFYSATGESGTIANNFITSIK